MTDPGRWLRVALGQHALGRCGQQGHARRASRTWPPIGVLLLPRELESFILRDQAEDLLTAPGVVAVEPARIPYGAYLRVPTSVTDGLAATQARRLRLPGEPQVIVIFHPLQYPLARGLIAQHREAELWYWRWDRYEVAYDATPRQRARLEELHLAATFRAERNIVVSNALGAIAREEGGEPRADPARGRLVPGAGPRRGPSSRSRSGISATGRTGRCCAPSPRGCRSWCCC